MNRIDRYILGLFWGFFIAGLVVFVTLFLSVDAMSTLVKFKGVELESLLKYYAVGVPEILYKMLPVSCLLATVFTLSTLQKNNELVALYSCGMSLVRICATLLISVTLICGLNLLLSDQVLPSFAKQKSYIYFYEILKKPSLYSTVKTNKIWYRSKDTIFYIKTLNDKNQTAQGLTLYYFDDQWNLVQMVTADEVVFRGSTWDLKKGNVTMFTKDSSFPLTSSFKEKTITMGEDSTDLTSTAQAAQMLSLKDLSRYIAKNKEAGLDTVRYEVDYHSKFGYALAALVMSLLGIPFSLGKARSGGTMKNVGICLGLVFLYWIFYSSSITLGNHGHVPAILAAWTPNFVMAGLASFFILRLRR